MTYKKKLIEVALPLDAINKASAREKSIRHGHPSTLHLWWARRPLAAARAVIFAQMVDDPSAHPDKFPTEEDQKKERERLFKLIEDLVKRENSLKSMSYRSRPPVLRLLSSDLCSPTSVLRPPSSAIRLPDFVPYFATSNSGLTFKRFCCQINMISQKRI